MTQVKAPDTPRPKEEERKLIPEDRLREILNILLPYGYSHHRKTFYTGISPYIGSAQNIITIVANDYGWSGGVLSICMDRFDEGEDEDNSLGFYRGIMKLIAPELNSIDDEFKGNSNVLDFDWASDRVLENVFPVEVKIKET